MAQVITPLEKVKRALAILIAGAPFDASVFSSMKLSVDNSIPTAATDCVSFVIYNEEWVGRMTPDDIATVFAHEAGHKWLMHAFRRGARDPKLWNIAGDYIINAELARRGFKFGPSIGAKIPVPIMCKILSGGMSPATARAQYKDGYPFDMSLTPTMTTEDVYDMLLAAQQQNESSAAGGMTLEDMREPEPGKPETSEKEATVAVMTAAASAKAIGKISGMAAGVVALLSKPPQDWRKHTKNFLQNARMVRRTNDTGYHRPSRRASGTNVLLPSRRVEPYGDYVIGVDTSGSVSDRELAVYGTEMNGVFSQLKPERVIVIYCDHDIQRVDVFEGGNIKMDKIHAVGRGGTRVMPPFDYVREHKIKPVGMIYFTDGDVGDWPERVPFPLLWGITSMGRDFVAPIGKTVHLKVEG